MTEPPSRPRASATLPPYDHRWRMLAIRLGARLSEWGYRAGKPLDR